MNWKDFLYFSRAESLAVLFILIIILLTLNLNFLLSKRNSSPLIISQNDSLIASFERLHSNMKEKTVEVQPLKNNPKENPKRVSSTSKHKDKTVQSFIENNEKQYGYPRQEKFKDTEFITLNVTDTAQWKKIPGIGSSYASRIIKYRDKLGGFTSINQLKEVYGIDDELFDKISSYIREENNCLESCRKLKINKLEFKEILAHPYIDYEQTKAIFNLRRRIGDISSIDELAMLDEFAAEDIVRLKPYLQF